MTLPRRLTVAGSALLTVGVLSMTACTASPTTPAATPSATVPTAGTVMLDNCGTTVTFDAAPHRVVTIKSTSLEMLLALGVGETIIGSAFQDGPVSTQWVPAEAPPVLSDKVPSQEVVLANAPDLVYAGWESNFSADGAGERASLANLGVNTYVSPAACKEPGYRPERMTFELVFGEIAEIGEIFRVPDAAAELISAQQAQLSAVVPNTAGLSALWFSSGSDTPYVGAATGAPQMIMDAVGLSNIASDIADTWSPMSWEAIVERNPDVIVAVDSPRNTAASKIELMKANPAVASLDAVRLDRFLVVPFQATEAGVRNVEAAVSLAEQLATLTDAR